MFIAKPPPRPTKEEVEARRKEKKRLKNRERREKRKEQRKLERVEAAKKRKARRETSSERPSKMAHTDGNRRQVRDEAVDMEPTPGTSGEHPVNAKSSRWSR